MPSGEEIVRVRLWGMLAFLGTAGALLSLGVMAGALASLRWNPWPVAQVGVTGLVLALMWRKICERLDKNA